jgi:hypothetical protein
MRKPKGDERAAEVARLVELADHPALRDWKALGLVIRHGEAHLVNAWTPLLILNQRAWAKSAILRVRRAAATDGRQGEA